MRERRHVTGGKRPSKLCSECRRRRATDYSWWLEETEVLFICKECRARRAVTPEELGLTGALRSRAA